MHGRIKKPRAPGPGYFKAPPREKKNCAPAKHARTHTHTQTQPNVLDFTVELDTLAIVLGK